MSVKIRVYENKKCNSYRNLIRAKGNDIVKKENEIIKAVTKILQKSEQKKIYSKRKSTKMKMNILYC